MLPLFYIKLNPICFALIVSGYFTFGFLKGMIHMQFKGSSRPWFWKSMLGSPGQMKNMFCSNQQKVNI